ncbi:MAG TPA: CHAT domain-containing protein, partial [Blastocatellia bacterium]|nr:CHAT domain-containing protein [Blastocatellia bacterium]
MSKVGLVAQLVLSLFTFPAGGSTQKVALRAPDPVDARSEADRLFIRSKELAQNRRDVAARETLAKALEILEKTGEQGRAIEMLLDIANLHRDLGNEGDAISYYRRLLRFEKLSETSKTNTLTSIAALYSKLGQFKLALGYYQESLAVARRIKDRTSEATCLIGLTSLLIDSGDTVQGSVFLDRLRGVMWPEADQKRVTAAVLWLTGRMRNVRDGSRVAKELLEQALLAYREVPSSDNDQVLLLCELSELCLGLKQAEPAYEYAKQAEGLASKLTSDEPHWRSQLSLARSLRALDRIDEARDAYYSALSKIEKQLTYLSPDLLKMSILEQDQAAYRELTSLAMQMNRNEEAMKLVEHARARGTLALLAEKSRIEGSLDQRRAQQDLARTIARLNNELLITTSDGQRRRALETALDEAQLKQEELLLDTQVEQQKRFTAIAGPSELQKRVLHPDEVLISFSLSPEKSFVWCLSNSEVSSATLPDRTTIQSKVYDYINALTARPKNLVVQQNDRKQMQLARELFDLLLGKFADQFSPERHLIIVPDGLLAYLPFETLVRGDRYLIEDHSISYVPSASVLASLRTRESTGKALPMDLLAFGAPTVRIPRPDFVPGATRQGSASSVPAKETDVTLLSLPGAFNEIKTIGQFFPRERQRAYVGASATESTLKHEQLANYRYLHLATHGIVDVQSPNRSGVLLAPDADPFEDGILQVSEIVGLD